MSPTIGMSTLTFFEIDDGSMSMWIIVSALGANSEILPVTRSSKRAPTAIRQSVLQTAVLVPYEPCIPSIPSRSESEAGNDPSPIRVSVTGMPSPLTSSRNSGAAPDHCTPPPT